MDYKDALEDMVDQFAYRSNDGTRKWLHTGGLSALEHAFHVLGWEDPHYVEEGGCEVAGCPKWSSCVAAYPRSLAKSGLDRQKIGFGHLCSDHFHQWNGRNAEAAADLGRLPAPRLVDSADAE